MINIFCFQAFYPSGGICDLLPRTWVDVPHAAQWLKEKFDAGVLQKEFRDGDAYFQIVSSTDCNDLKAMCELVYHWGKRKEDEAYSLKWYNKEEMGRFMLDNSRIRGDWWA